MYLPILSLPQEQDSLTGKDLLAYEPRLAECFSTCFTFTTHGLSFPTSIPDAMLPEDTSRELRASIEDGRVVIPLQWGEKLLGIFAASGVDEQALQPILPALPKMARMALETVFVYRASLTDPLTGLHNHLLLQSLVTNEITMVLSSILPGPDSTADSEYRSCFALIHIDMDGFTRINSRFGHAFGDSVLVDVGKTLQAHCPSQAQVFRAEGAAFFLFWPQGTPARCRHLADTLVDAIADRSLESPVAREPVTLSASAGYAVYPTDMSGHQFRRSAEEQARIILEKTHKAARSAKTMGGDTVFAYKDILKQGVTILEMLPLNRMLISAGNNLDLTEGTRFFIWPGTVHPFSPSPNQTIPYPAMYKGEMLVQEVGDQTSVGEILFLSDPSWTPCVGDRLSLIESQEPCELSIRPSQEGQHDHQQGVVLGLREFILRWTQMRTATETFVLALCWMNPGEASVEQETDQRVEQVYKAIQTLFPKPHLVGRYSANTLICFFPDLDEETALEQGRALSAASGQDMGLDLHIGMAGYPLLHYSKAEMLDNARKALEHALLLTRPDAVLFDSISLTISADRMFTKGHCYAALEEYQRALVLDPANLLARNSLGICYARLGRMEEAKRHFQTVVEQGGKELMALYNYGYACLRTGEDDKAHEAFTQCLTIDPTHVYSLIRLGRLAEQRGDLQEAEASYQQAGSTPHGKGMAARHLAHLALDRGEQDKARELLHQALIFEPNDAFALNMLAKLYLEQGDDPEIAENLARQSVHVRPDIPELWMEVARALEASGKTEEARAAHLRSRS